MPARTERMPYTEEQIERLVALYLIARETRRQDPIGSPKRAAGDEFTAEIARIRDSVDPQYTYYELAQPLMIPNKKTGELKPMNQRQLRLYLGRRGHEILPESQQEYKANDPNYVPIKPNLRTAEHFSCKHWIDPEGNDVPEGDPRADQEVFCERTPENTWIHRFTRVNKSGEVRHYELDACRRHQLMAAAKWRAKNPEKVRKASTKAPAKAPAKAKSSGRRGTGGRA